MDIKKKKEALLKSLEEYNIKDLFETVYDDSEMFLIVCNNVSSAVNRLSLELRNSNYDNITYSLGKFMNPEKRSELLELFNKLNAENVLCKFCIEENDFMIVQMTLVSSEDYFDSDQFVILMKMIFDVIEKDYYKRIMKVIWS